MHKKFIPGKDEHDALPQEVQPFDTFFNVAGKQWRDDVITPATLGTFLEQVASGEKDQEVTSASEQSQVAVVKEIQINIMAQMQIGQFSEAETCFDEDLDLLARQFEAAMSMALVQLLGGRVVALEVEVTSKEQPS